MKRPNVKDGWDKWFVYAIWQKKQIKKLKRYNRKELKGWDIVGMNHYYVDDFRYLFIAMSKNGKLIKVEGFDNDKLWSQLVEQALKI